PRAHRHAAHEDGEDQGLRIRGVAEEELEVVRPDRFVDETREPRRGEERDQGRPDEALHAPRNLAEGRGCPKGKCFGGSTLNRSDGGRKLTALPGWRNGRRGALKTP